MTLFQSAWRDLFFVPSTLCFLVGWSVASSCLWVFAFWLDVQSEEQNCPSSFVLDCENQEWVRIGCSRGGKSGFGADLLTWSPGGETVR